MKEQPKRLPRVIILKRFTALTLREQGRPLVSYNIYRTHSETKEAAAHEQYSIRQPLVSYIVSTNPETKKVATRELYSTNSENKKAAARELYSTNPETKKAGARELYSTNSETKKATARELYSTN